jgi:multisubunit Na+/H+ antiporter MnhF subunit
MDCLVIAVIIIVVVFIGTIIFFKYCERKGIHFQGDDFL